MNPYTGYQFLSFVIPGGLILFASFYGWNGWPYSEPGATVLVGILAAAYAVGAANAGVASWVEPVMWLHRPGSRQDPTWGMFGDHGTYPEAERDRVLGDLRARYGQDVDLRKGYGLAYTELQHAGKDSPLNIANENIGFYRNMTVACLASAGVVVGYAWVGRDGLAAVAWVPIFLASTLVFAARYRRFWRRFGDYVIRGFRVLPPRPTR